jgi:N-acetylneuraminic acid mutarotase
MRTLLGMVLLSAACGASPSAPTSAGAVSETEPPEDPCASAGTWAEVAPLDLPGRVDHTAVWTGTEMVMWGGTQGMRSPRGDGARYDPASDTWHAVAADDAPVERDDHAAVWTGEEMIVWGGNRESERTEKLDSGGRYDPVADRWRALPGSGLSGRDDPRAVWTGRAMIVWGGRDGRGHTGDGALYSPAQDRWVRMSTRGGPEPREDHTAVWTGREMIVWGGWNGGSTRNYALDAAAYDPATDRWRPISRDGAPEPREDHVAIWTGTEMIVWGGVRREPPRDDDEAASPEDDAGDDAGKGGVAQPDRRQLATGGRYDPATDTWTPITMSDAPDAREDGVVVWTGRDMLVWGGQSQDVPMASGARYVAAADTWCPIAADGAPAARRDHAGVWTGHALVLWGGRDPDGAYPATGAAFVP